MHKLGGNERLSGAYRPISPRRLIDTWTVTEARSGMLNSRHYSWKAAFVQDLQHISATIAETSMTTTLKLLYYIRSGKIIYKHFTQSGMPGKS